MVVDHVFEGFLILHNVGDLVMELLFQLNFYKFLC